MSCEMSLNGTSMSYIKDIIYDTNDKISFLAIPVT